MTIRGTSHDYRALREQMASGIQAWKDEILATVRPLVRAAMKRNGAGFQVRIEPREIVLRRCDDGEWIELGRVQRDSQDRATELSACLAGWRLSGKAMDATLLLPEEDLLRPQIAFPKASRAIARKALEHEVSRLSPLPSNAIHFDYCRNLNVGGRANSITLRIIKREIVSDAIALCAHAGLNVGEIGFTNESQLADWRAFPVDKAALLRLAWQRWRVPILALTALVLALVSTVAAYERNAAAQSVIAASLAAAETRMPVIGRLQSQIEETRRQAAFLEQERRQPLFASLLAECADVLPDGTWITSLEAEDGRIHLHGYSRSATDLVALFDKSPRFANAQFDAPLVRDASRDVDRFDLTVSVRPNP